MKIFKNRYSLQREISGVKNISFVPTMGGLHSGHVYLIKKASKSKGKVLVSIYVNPKQFNNKKDFLDGIKWCFKEIKDKENKLGLEARINVEKNFSNEFVSKKYVKLYEDLLTK